MFPKYNWNKSFLSIILILSALTSLVFTSSNPLTVDQCVSMCSKYSSCPKVQSMMKEWNSIVTDCEHSAHETSKISSENKSAKNVHHDVKASTDKKDSTGHSARAIPVGQESYGDESFNGAQNQQYSPSNSNPVQTVHLPFLKGKYDANTIAATMTKTLDPKKIMESTQEGTKMVSEYVERLWGQFVSETAVQFPKLIEILKCAGVPLGPNPAESSTENMNHHS